MKKITAQQKTAWFEAAKDNDIKTVKRMIEEGIDVNIKSSLKWTALHSVCYWGHIDLAKILIDNGADVNAKDDEDWTALHSASYYDFKDILVLLLKNGADVNSQNQYFRTLLHLACYRGNLDLAKILIDNGADITIKDKDGNVPLDDLKKRHHQKHEELMVWLSEEYPDKALEVIALENVKGKGIGL